MSYDVNKLTKLAALKALAQKMSAELAEVEAAIPTNVSQLTNDSGYQTSAQVTQAIQTAISKTGHASFQKADAVPEAESAQENILYLVMNPKTSHYDIYAKVENEVVLLDDTTVDLTGYVQKDGDKVLSDNNYTDAEKSKLAGIAENANNYTHPAHDAHESGFWKVTADAQGHVTSVEPVTKTDITNLGIPAQDTTYSDVTAGGASGLMTGSDKTKLDGIAEGATKVEASSNPGYIKVNGAETPVVAIATDEEVTEMLNEVFPASV